MSNCELMAPAPGQVVLADCADAEPLDGQVLIETRFSVVSPGTERAFVHNDPGTPGTYPLGLGYAAVGVVLRCGPGAERFRPGQAVAFPGRHRARQCVEERRCHALPDGIDPRAAACYPLVSIALNGVRRGGVGLGDRVAVVGLGPIGLLAGQLARCAGAVEVVGVDPQPARRRLGEGVACTRSLDSVAAAGDDRFRVVLEASGVPAAVPQACALVATSGTVVLLGSTRGAVDGFDVYRLLHRTGASLVGAHGPCRPTEPDRFGRPNQHDDEVTALAFIADGRVRLAPLLADALPPSEAPRAYRRDAGGDTPLLPLIGWQQAA